MQAHGLGRLPDLRPHAGEQSGGVDFASPSEGSSYQKLAAGGIALLLFAVLWGAWVLVIGFRPCSLSSLLWR
jgi:hypothetical protein